MFPDSMDLQRKSQKSVIPVSFWFLSLGGSLLLLVYAIHLKDPVFIIGQTMGNLIYARNLILIKGSPINSVD